MAWVGRIGSEAVSAAVGAVEFDVDVRFHSLESRFESQRRTIHKVPSG